MTRTVGYSTAGFMLRGADLCPCLETPMQFPATHNFKQWQTSPGGVLT